MLSLGALMSFFAGLGGFLGFDLFGTGNAPGSEQEVVRIIDESDAEDSAQQLSALRGMSQDRRRSGGVVERSNRDAVSSDTFSAGVEGASTNNVNAVDDPSGSLSGGPKGNPHSQRKALRFKATEKVEVTECDQYLKSVLNWKAEPFVGRSPLSASVQFGPYNLADLEEAVKEAADQAGFSLYAHKGVRSSETSCSLKFGCECGRKRYGKEKVAIEKKEHVLVKDLNEVVRETSGKRKSTRKGGGYLKARTQRSRVKSKDCSWAFCISSVGDKWSKDSPCLWSLNPDKRCSNCFNHSNHCRRPHRKRISAAVKDFICENGESMAISNLIQKIYSKHGVEVSADQVKYVMKCNKIKNKERSSGGSKAGGAMDALQYLLRTKESDVVLMLNECISGKWFTGECELSETETAAVSLFEYVDIVPTRISKPDAQRVIDIEGTEYFVWSAAWNYRAEKELFSAYPHVVQMDCMHGVTSSTDGFNAVGIDGNGHNICIMRAFVGNQNGDVFRWLFSVAFPKLVPQYQNIRVFFVDGCSAMNPQLRAACCAGQQFPNASVFRCLFHLITKTFDDKFGMGDGWQQEVKKYLFRLRRCETEEEFSACSEFVMRQIAQLPNLGASRSALRARVLEFVQSRIDCSHIWVLKNQLKAPTRGCLATARVEGTHGHDRTNDKINARNSWFTTTKRHSERSGRRHRAKKAWASRQLGSELLRSAMNPADSIFKEKDLKTLDAVFLPWALETLEEQALLARRMQVVYKTKGLTSETKKYQADARTKPSAAEFSVWVEKDDASDDGDALNADLEELDKDSDDSSSSNDASSVSSSSSEGGKRERDDSAADEEVSDGDLQETDFDADDYDDFDADAYMTKCADTPLPPRATFHWQKVRTVTLAPQYDDQQKLTGKYIMSCSCGFTFRIGVCCRHMLAVLFYYVCKVAAARRARDDSSSGSDSADEIGPTEIHWLDISSTIFQDLCNMEICSKIKYHAALHEKGHLFASTARAVFRPTVLQSLAQEFLQEFEPDRNRRKDIPTNGLPSESDDIDNIGHNHAEETRPAKATQQRDHGARTSVPTLYKCSSVLEDSWNFTTRFSPTDRTAARKMILERQLELQTEIRAMETKHVAESDLTRRFSRRDMFKAARKEQ
jgi:hypothetical protein